MTAPAPLPWSAWRGMGRRLSRRTRGRPFEAFQVEVTTRCNLRCVMCPRTALGDQWPELDLPWEAFVRIGNALERVRHVHLQGWGEPLLHARLLDMVAMAKAAGCRVGLTTNGMRLQPEIARRLLELDLDLLAVSIAGATPETHERIRVGSHLPTLLENVRHLLALRRGKQPKVEFSYLMTRTNLAELPRAVQLAGELGVDEVYATNLDYVASAEQEELAAFGCPASADAFRAYVREAGEAARRAGVAFRPYPLQAEEVSVCEANPLKILFIASDGWVSPCTYMGLAGRTTIPRRFEGEATIVPRLRFGNIMDQEVSDIWESAEYLSFRNRFLERKLGAALSLLGAAAAEDPIPRPAPPDPCRSCYKLYGL